ncbi:unnamed protein product [Ixodes hexagonus]
MVLRFSVLQALVLAGVTTVRAEVQASPEVRTSSGSLVGVRLRGETGGINAYLGIPFAEPPIGERRFKNPVPVNPWNGVFRANRMHPGCVQTNFSIVEGAQFDMSETEEDCLKLNIWVPERNCDGDVAGCGGSLPVFVYIYGGYFSWGSSDLFFYDGVEFAYRANVIYVSFNYRVGIIGFLNASSAEAPGNMGLYDQLEALRWIHRNIKYFGGDPGAITLAGHSAGSISVGYHVISEMSEGLFQRAIMISGTPSSLSYSDDVDQDAILRTVCRIFNCIDFHRPFEAQTSECVTCLRKIDAHRLVQESQKGLGLKYIAVLPGYGDSLLPNSSLDLDNNRIHVKDVLIGTVEDDGAFLMKQFQSRLKWLKGLIDGPTVIRVFLQSFYNIGPSKSAQLADAYFNQTEKQEETETLKALSAAVSDLGFNCPTDVFADAASGKNVSVFRYLFGHRPSFSFWDDWITVTHNEELPFFLGTIRTAGAALRKKYGEPFAALLKDLKPNLQELSFSDELIHSLAEFCRTGKPKIPKTDQDWPKYTKEDKAYVILKPNDYSIAHGPRSKKCHLWEPYLVKRKQAPTSPASKPKPTPKRIPEKRPSSPLRPIDNVIDSSATSALVSQTLGAVSLLICFALTRPQSL